MEDKGILSGFNEGALQMQRIHDLQSRINLLNVNPLWYDSEKARYNYEMIFTCLNSLFAEVSSKLSSKEEEEGLKTRKKIKDFLLTNLIFSKPIIVKRNGRDCKRVDVLTKNWNELQELLFHYELKVRKYLEEHNLTAPKGDDPDRAAYK